MDDAHKVFEFIRPGGLVATLLILLAAWLVGHLLSRFVQQMGARFTDKRLQINQIGAYLRFFIYILGIAIAVLFSFNLSREMLLALGGSVAVMVGFSLKDLASSLIAGLTILIDKPFQVGDRVTFAGYYGEITLIGLRSVRLVTLDDIVVTIPNNKFLTEAVASGNMGALDMLIVLDFYVGIDQDIARAKEIVTEAITSSRYAYLRKPWTVLVNQVFQGDYLAVRLRAKVCVLDVHYEKALETDVTERVLEGFAQAGVQPPAVLHRTLDRPSAKVPAPREAMAERGEKPGEQAMAERGEKPGEQAMAERGEKPGEGPRSTARAPLPAAPAGIGACPK